MPRLPRKSRVRLIPVLAATLALTAAPIAQDQAAFVVATYALIDRFV